MPYAGLSNVELGCEAFELGQGLKLTRTYAHLTAPHLMAFAPPNEEGWHPAPWRTALGGFSYDIQIELFVPDSVASEENPDDTIWHIAALLRLIQFPYLNVPVISNQSFSEAATSKVPPVLRPFETTPRILKATGPKAQIVSIEQLEWVRDTWPETMRLMRKSGNFAAAFRAFDSSTIRGRTSSSLLGVWGALEQLFAPSAGELRYRVSANIASFLEPAGPKRLALFRKVLDLYNKRSKAAHTASDTAVSALVESYILLRNALMKMVNEAKVPSQKDLEVMLFCADTSEGEDGWNVSPATSGKDALAE